MVGMTIDAYLAEGTPERDAALYAELRALAAKTVREAAELIRARRADIVATDGLAAHTVTKTSAVDPVTIVDQAAEKFIVHTLRAARPQDGFLGEEGAAEASESGVTWVVDPIDGTVNFLYGIPDYAVSVGAVIDGVPVAGAVINVVQDILYHAAAGAGAVVERAGKAPQQLRCRTERDVSRALLATGFGYSAARRSAQARVLVDVLPRVRDIRRMGAAALDICRVAEGSVDAYYEHGIKPWDFVGGTVIAREAGAIVEHAPLAHANGQGQDQTMAAGGSDVDVEPARSGALYMAASASVYPGLAALFKAAGVPQEIPS